MLSMVIERSVGTQSTINANDLLISAEVENLLSHVVFSIGVGAELCDLAVAQLDFHSAESLVIPAEQDLADVLASL